MFVDSVRSPQKREVIRLVQKDFREQLLASGVRVAFRPLSLEAMRGRCDEGCVPIVLISSYRFDREKQPHWVVVIGFDENYIYLHDPNEQYVVGPACGAMYVLGSSTCVLARLTSPTSRTSSHYPWRGRQKPHAAP